MTTSILQSTSRKVQGQTTVNPAVVAVPILALPSFPLNGSIAIKGRIQGFASDGSGQQSVEIDTVAKSSNGTIAATSAAQVLLPALAGQFTGLAVALTPGPSGGSAGEIAVTPTASQTVPVMWSWDLTYSVLATA